MPTPMDNGYKMVADRHLQFVADHPNGSVSTQVEHFIFDPSEGKGFVTVTASVWKEYEDRAAGKPPNGTGNASMPIPGPTSFTKNSEVENCETSALGRALAMVGYHAKETMASGDEISSKDDGSGRRSRSTRKPKEDADGEEQQAEDPMAPKLRRMYAMAKEAGINLSTDDGKKTLQAIVFAATNKRSSKQLTEEDMPIIYETLSKDESERDALVAGAAA